VNQGETIQPSISRNLVPYLRKPEKEGRVHAREEENLPRKKVEEENGFQSERANSLSANQQQQKRECGGGERNDFTPSLTKRFSRGQFGKNGGGTLTMVQGLFMKEVFTVCGCQGDSNIAWSPFRKVPKSQGGEGG